MSGLLDDGINVSSGAKSRKRRRPRVVREAQLPEQQPDPEPTPEPTSEAPEEQP